MARRPTILDVARRAGVSKGAVSFALNGRPGLAPATRDRILVAARELDWQPSSRAATRMRSRVAGARPGRPLSANETAPLLTPARRATSRIVGRRAILVTTSGL